MRKSNRFQGTAGAVSTAFAIALLVTGVAQAQEVFDGAATVSDKNDSDADALVVNAGNSANVDVRKVCVEGGDEVEIRSISNHPDATSADKGKAEVAQAEKGNQPVILVGGSGMMNFDVELACDKAEVSGEADLDKSKGKFEIKAKKCAGLTADQVTFVRDVCANAKNTKIKSDGAELKKLQVKGKGPAVAAEA